LGRGGTSSEEKGRGKERKLLGSKKEGSNIGKDLARKGK